MKKLIILHDPRDILCRKCGEYHPPFAACVQQLTGEKWKKAKDSKYHLCNDCQLHFATCPKARHIKFGDGVGNDNVIECSEFKEKI